MNDLEKKIVGVLETVDEMGNVILGAVDGIPAAGNPHFTISQRIGQEETMGTPEEEKIAKIGDEVLTAIEKDVIGIQPEKSHCLDAISDFPTNLPSAG